MNVFDILREKLGEKAFDMSLENSDCKAVWLDRAIEIVNQVEQEYNNGWIPCSERYPEEYNRVLGCDASGSVMIVSLYTDSAFGTIWKIWNGGLLTRNCIVVWQPLPEKYRGEVIT